MSVPYDQAIETIASVVGNSFDKEVISMVLESNQGHMERTIEQLLQMNGTVEVSNKDSNVNNAPSLKMSQDQILDDELYARMVQDELFMQEMQADPDFEAIFGRQVVEQQRRMLSSPRNQNRPQNVSSSSSTPPETDIIDDIKKFGDAAKLKLKEWALKFKRRNQPQEQSGNPSRVRPEKTDEATVVTLDTSVTRRTTFNDDEVPLKEPKKDNPPANFSIDSPEEQQSLLGKHAKVD